MFNKIKNISWKYVLLEILPLILILVGFMLVLSNISNGLLKDFVFANADMLTLSLVHQTILLNEPFHWIFSSQIFLFPEAIIYSISSLFGGNFKVTLIINALIAIVLLYAAMRLIMKSFSKSKLIVVSFSLFYILTVLLLQASEPRNDTSIAMYYFVTTAYYGVILSGLVALGLLSSILSQKNSKKLSTKTKVLLAVFGALSFLVGLSNPLFFLQVSAPLLVVIVIQRLFGFISTKLLLILGGITIGSIILTTIVRKIVFSQFFSTYGNISSYFHFEDIKPAVKTFLRMLLEMFNGTVGQRVELLLLIAVTLFAITMFVYVAIMRIKKSKGLTAKIQSHHFFIITFAAVAPVTTALGSLLTGNAIMRYMMPILFFAPLAIIPLYVYLAKSHILLVKIGILTLTVVLFLVGIILIKDPVSMTKDLVNYYPTATKCMDEKLSGTNYKNGIAQYWRARVMQLNSRDGHIVEQTDATMKRFTWLYNQSSYDMYDLSFVIVDKPAKITNPELSGDPFFTIQAPSVNYAFGVPSNLYQCEDFDIWAYDKGTRGHTILNSTVRDRTMGF